MKVALQESTRAEWNGDVDLGDGQLAELRAEYDSRRLDLVPAGVGVTLTDLEADLVFLQHGLQQAVSAYQKKFNKPGTSTEALMTVNWNVVEHQTLLQQAEDLLRTLRGVNVDPTETDAAFLRRMDPYSEDYRAYLRNLFKKKRTAATHVLVVMVSDEQRSVKPYALPLQYIPYLSLRDQYIRDLLRGVKRKLTDAGLTVVGK